MGYPVNPQYAYVTYANYEFGDISKEVMRRATSADVNIGDLLLLMRVLSPQLGTLIQTWRRP